MRTSIYQLIFLIFLDEIKQNMSCFHFNPKLVRYFGIEARFFVDKRDESKFVSPRNPWNILSGNFPISKVHRFQIALFESVKSDEKCHFYPFRWKDPIFWLFCHEGFTHCAPDDNAQIRKYQPSTVWRIFPSLLFENNARGKRNHFVFFFFFSDSPLGCQDAICLVSPCKFAE